MPYVILLSYHYSRGEFFGHTDEKMPDGLGGTSLSGKHNVKDTQLEKPACHARLLNGGNDECATAMPLRVLVEQE